MRKKIVAGNWKMNKNYTEAQELMHELDRYKRTMPSTVRYTLRHHHFI